MDERIKAYIDALKKSLAGLPEEEAADAVGYYEEYLNDALEAGKDLDTVIAQLDPPQKAAGIIRAETSILRAQRSPGLKNYTRVVKDVTHGVTAPLAVTGISLFVFISYCMVIVLFAAAFATFAAAAAAGLGMIYEAFRVPSAYALEIAGTIGIGLFAAGLLLLAAYGFYKCGRLFILLSSKLISRMLKRGRTPAPAADTEAAVRKSRPRRLVYSFLAVTALGLVLASVSGIPVKYFTIFNSMKPDFVMRSAEYQPDKISKLSIVTANSHIRLTKSTTNKITVTYEQPDWLDYELGTSGSMLSFYEKSNGRLPLYDLASIHECMTEVTIGLPDGFQPQITELDSTGGHIAVDRITDNLEIKTYTGEIALDFGGNRDKYDIEASTGSGSISLDGSAAGRKSNDGLEYYSVAGSGKSVIVKSSSGSISIR